MKDRLEKRSKVVAATSEEEKYRRLLTYTKWHCASFVVGYFADAPIELVGILGVTAPFLAGVTWNYRSRFLKQLDRQIDESSSS